MAIQTWWLRQVNTGATNPNRLWWDRDPAAGNVTQATSATGWNLGTTVPRYGLMNSGVEVGRASLVTTSTLPDNTAPTVELITADNLQNSTDSISTNYPYNGYFASGTWTFTFPFLAVSNASGQDFSLQMRVFAAALTGLNSWGTIRELTSAVLSSTTITNLTTTITQSCVFTWTPGIISLSKEFIICKIAVAYTGAATNNNADCAFRYGSGCTMVTPDFRAREYNIT